MTLPDYILKELEDNRDRKIAEALAENPDPAAEDAIRKIFAMSYKWDVDDFEGDFLPILALVWDKGWAVGYDDGTGDRFPASNPFEPTEES